MAEATRYSNVIIPTDGQTILGPVEIIAIKVVDAGSGTTVTIKDANSVVLYKTIIAANLSEFDEFSAPWKLRSQTYTINVSNSALVFIYLR